MKIEVGFLTMVRRKRVKGNARKETQTPRSCARFKREAVTKVLITYYFSFVILC